MNPTILGESQYTYRDMIRRKMITCIAILAVTVVLNAAVMLVCTKENLSICMLLNTVLDVIAGWFCVWQFDRFIVPGRKLLRLYRKKGTIVSGDVEEISEQTERYYGFDCWIVMVSGHKVFVVDNGLISLNIGQTVSLETVHGIVKEVLL